MFNCKNNNCKNTVKTSRGKSGYCQPCSARRLMNNKWATIGNPVQSSLRYCNQLEIAWLQNEALKHNVKVSVLIASIIRDAYYEEKNG